MWLAGEPKIEDRREIRSDQCRAGWQVINGLNVFGT